MRMYVGVKIDPPDRNNMKEAFYDVCAKKCLIPEVLHNINIFKHTAQITCKQPKGIFLGQSSADI